MEVAVQLADKTKLSTNALGAGAIARVCLLCAFSLAALAAPGNAQVKGLNGIGINLAGPEFSTNLETFSNLTPGIYDTDYVFPGEATVRFFANQNANFIRLPIRWERVQSQPGGPLDQEYLNRILTFCDYAEKHRIGVLIDVHNYGRYHLSIGKKTRAVVIDEEIEGRVPVSRDHFANLWNRLARKLVHHPAVVGYGLMNEPHQMGNSDWKAISQAATTSIRTIDRNSAIVVSGLHWSSAERFESANGPKAWIEDQVGPVIYEAHIYFDHDTSGEYTKSYDDEQKIDRKLDKRATQRITPFLNWCKKNSARGLVGEVGCPADLRWKPHFQTTASLSLREKIPVCCWAAGPWWGEYPLSVQPVGGMPALQWRWLVETKNRIHVKPNQMPDDSAGKVPVGNRRLVTELFDQP